MKACAKGGGRLTAVLLLSAVLAACGGDGDRDSDGSPAATPAPSAGTVPATVSTVPASAGGSVAAYLAYLRGLRTDEMSAPVSIGRFVAPVDDAAPAMSLGS